MAILSICIPTYNRISYLTELLDGLLSQIQDVSTSQIELLVSDNASTDGTAECLKTLKSPNIRWWTNPQNIGGDRNFLTLIHESNGDYIWLIGDDDIVPEGAVLKVMRLLNEENPDLLFSFDREEVSPRLYAGYRQFLEKWCARSCVPMLSHTLISANIFRRSLFDMELAERTLYTQYAHMFGLARNLQGKLVASDGLISVRPVRAEFASYPSCLCVKQAIYMCYIAREFHFWPLYLYAVINACNLPLEYASRFKNWIMRRIKGRHQH